MRSREERRALIKEKMQRKGKKDGYTSEKAEDFKEKYKDDVKSAVNARRAHKDGRQRSRGTEEERAKMRQDRRKAERASGTTAKEQRANADKLGGYYGKGYK